MYKFCHFYKVSFSYYVGVCLHVKWMWVFLVFSSCKSTSVCSLGVALKRGVDDCYTEVLIKKNCNHWSIVLYISPSWMPSVGTMKSCLCLTFPHLTNQYLFCQLLISSSDVRSHGLTMISCFGSRHWQVHKLSCAGQFLIFVRCNDTSTADYRLLVNLMMC